MKTFDMKMIRSWQPCYDPSRHLPEDWSGTPVDLLKMDKIPFQDRLWAVLRTDLISERTMRLFAVWSARQAAKYVKDNERQKFNDILDVLHRFAMGEATETERAAARAAARDAARAAARDAARAAAWAAARDAARDAARAAAWDAAWDAQRDKLIEMIKKE